MLCVCDIGLVACCVAERGHGRSGRSRHEGVPRPKGGCVTRGRVDALSYPPIFWLVARPLVCFC